MFPMHGSVREITVAIPTTEQLGAALLEELADGVERSNRELRERLALRFGLTASELAECGPDGCCVFQQRIQEACTQLEQRGLLESPERSRSRITAAGIEALVSGSRDVPATTPHIGPGPLEVELRRLTGPGVARPTDWRALCLLSGWGAGGVFSYAEVANRTGYSVSELHELDMRCRRGDVGEAPVLDAVLAFASAHPWADAGELAFHLAQLGLVWTPFSAVGICEAARRFGRDAHWRTLVRALATSRGRGAPDDCRRLPRPFESWFEVEVFLFLEDLGYHARPQERVGVYRADLVVEDLATPALIECDGETWHRGDRAGRDLAREYALLGRGYTVLSITHAEWRERTARTQDSIRSALRELDPLRSAG
jgi:very-short-patch-repair endonuclease